VKAKTTYYIPTWIWLGRRADDHLGIGSTQSSLQSPLYLP
jgi:hypothetical protein